MITMEILGRIRRMHLRDALGFSEIARRTGLSRNTIKRWLKGATAGMVAAPRYRRRAVARKLAKYIEQIERALVADSTRIKRDRRTGKQIFAEIKAAGYSGGYTGLTDFIRAWQRGHGRQQLGALAFVPLAFAFGEAFQFDWSEEGLMVGGVYYRMQVSHMKLCASRAFWLVAYPSQGHEMLFDAHTRSFAAFGGVPRRGIYDNMRTAVDKVGRGKTRTVNARFAAMCAHYLFDPDFCNVASGWEKGVVEKNVQDARRRIWIEAKTRRFGSFDELNGWLDARCRALWTETGHPEHKQFTVAEMLEHEQAQLMPMPMPMPFDGYVETLCWVSSTCLVVVDGNRYSVPCEWVRQMVSARVYSTRIEIVGGMPFQLDSAGDSEAAEGFTACKSASHARMNNRGRTAYDWQHYIPLIQRKPGALRNGAPFAEMPAALKRLSAQLLRRQGGDRIMAQVLAVVPKAGLEAVVVAVELMLEGTGVSMVSAEHVINVISRLAAAPMNGDITHAVHAPILLAELPLADTARYDRLRIDSVNEAVAGASAGEFVAGGDHA